MSARIYHILGIDTDVGKTYTMSLLLEHIHQIGKKALPLKPIHSGWPKNREWGEDLECHRKHIPDFIKPTDLCRYAFAEAISPFSAAHLEDRRIELETCKSFIDSTTQREGFDYFLIEGIGGVCCPLNPEATYLDLLSQVPHPVILVARVGLGSLNHTIMSVNLLKAKGLEIKALFLNRERAYAPDDLAANRAKWELEQLLDVPIVGPFEYQADDANLKILADSQILTDG